MKVIYWEDKNELNKIDWIKKYNNACLNFQKKSHDEISYLCSYFTIKEHKKFIQEIISKIDLNLSGNGLEIGAGPGMLSISLIKIFKNINNIILLDKVPNISNLQIKLATHLKIENKVTSVVGDYNNLKLKDESLDFVLDFDSVHHSTNFDLTFKEVSRVLKPGGIFLCFDRGQPNYISRKHIDFLLDIEYNDKYKVENSIDINKKFTRRMNGETEPYLKDWINTGLKYNLTFKIFIFHKKSLKNLIKNIYGLTPFFVRKIFRKGYNITTHYQVILSYLNINKWGNIKVFKLNYNPKKSKSPKAKMVFYFKKNIKS